MLYKKKKPSVTLTADTFFYAIPLKTGQFELKRSILEEHYAVPKGRKPYYGNQVEYLTYARGLVTVSVRLNNGIKATLYLHVEPDALHVACSCGMSGEKLCLHAYIGLYHLTWNDILDLSDWYWPGYDTNEKVQQRYLDIQVAKNYITAKPKPPFGHLFRPANESNGFQFLPQLSDVSLYDPDPMRGNRTVMAFCVGYGRAPAGEGQLPLLFACRAQTTADNLSLNNFTEITCSGETDCLASISSNQLCLLDIAKEMRQLVYKNVSDQHSIKSLMLLLWEKALPLLHGEPYTCLFNPYRVVYQNGKIAALKKGFIWPCRFSLSRPVLYFILRVHREYLSLSAALSINGRELEFNHKPELFAVELEAGCHYLAQSAEADDCLNWMYARQNRVTVLKSQFAAFHDMFLNDLAGRFPVYVLNGSGDRGKFSLYDYRNLSQCLET